jgi:hypothetical protein
VPLHELHDCIDEGYLIERKRGQVMTPPTRHRDAILTDDSQIARHTVDWTCCRIACTNRHHVIAAHQRVDFRAVQNELRQGIRAVNARIREESDGRLAATSSNCPGLTGCNNKRAMDGPTLSKRCALRADVAAKLRPFLRQRPRRALEAQAQVTKQGTVIQKVGEHEIRHTSKGLNVEPNVGDDVLIELIGRAAEWYEGGLTAYGPADFQLRIARVAGANHLAVSFADPELEKARAVAQAAAPAPVNKAALEYITERNLKRDRIADIPFHRL